MNTGTATIILENPEALKTVASAGRISTTGGSALEVLKKSDGGRKDLQLVGEGAFLRAPFRARTSDALNCL